MEVFLNKRFIDTTPNSKDVVNKGQVDYFGLPILGNITSQKNVDLLKQSPVEEVHFNKPHIAYEYIAARYVENGKLYGQQLYESEHDLVFIDTDVFRQHALYFKEFGKYCPFDESTNPDGYRGYWDLVEYRRRYGMTAWAGLDKNGNRRLVHCPGNMFGWLNFGPILRVADNDLQTDNEEEFNDTEGTEENSIMDIRSLLKSLSLDTSRVVKKVADFPAFFDGQYHLIIAKNFAKLIGKNFFFGKARRKGCSYFNSFDQFNNIDLNPNVTVVLAAFDKKYLITGKGLMKMLYTYADWMTSQTDFFKNRSNTSKEHLRFGFFYEKETVERGWKSEALAVSARNNPDVTIGKDVYEIDYEELGKFNNFLDSYDVTTSTAEAGAYRTGMIAGWGTAGTDEANWKDFEAIAYNPSRVNNLACNNIWDDNKTGTAVCYWYPHLQALEGCMDYNGNTNYKLALEDYKAKEAEVSKASDKAIDLEKWKAQRANSPSEAFRRGGDNLFNKDMVERQLKNIQTNPLIRNARRCGIFKREKDDKVAFIMNQVLEANGEKIHPPIDDFPIKKGIDMHGCIVEWLPPYRHISTGKVPSNMYVAWQDQYALSKEVKDIKIKDSLGATYWFELPNPFTAHKGMMPVASFVGRPADTDVYNEQVLLGCDRYNAKMLFESNIGDTFRYFKAANKLTRLFKDLKYTFDRDLATETSGYGIRMNDLKKSRGAVYLKQLLETPVGTNEDGETVYFIEYINDAGFLEEILRWNMKGNFDRVSAWIVGSFLLKEIETMPQREFDVIDENPSSVFNREWFSGIPAKNKGLVLLGPDANFDNFVRADIYNQKNRQGKIGNINVDII